MRDQARIIRWEEPPPRTAGGGRPRANGGRSPSIPGGKARWALVAAELRSRPGRYAVILENGRASSLGSQVSLGRMFAFQPAGHYEGTTRYRDGLATVYARYLGDGGAG